MNEMSAEERRWGSWVLVASVSLIIFGIAALYIGDNEWSMWWAILAFSGGVVIGTMYPGKSALEELKDAIEGNREE